MSRIVPYRLQCPEKCLQAQNQALNSTFFILRQTGPTAFVIKDNQRLLKVFSSRRLFEKWRKCIDRFHWVINISVLVMHFNAIEIFANISVGFF